jgi:hypothetical protein
MPYAKLVLRPGIDKQNTEYGAEGGWIDSDYVRFRYGLPEKIGGWIPFAENLASLVGLASNVLAWSNLIAVPYMAVGTNRKLYVFTGGAWYDITPIRETKTGLTFATTSGSTTVTVTHSGGHGAEIGDFVTFSSVTGDPGGISNSVLENEFEILSTPTGATYTIEVPTPATSTASGAGDATGTYQINVGSDVTFFDFGWGVGGFGLSPYGEPAPASGTLALASRVWQLDTFGENLIAQVNNGGVYQWSPTTDGVNNRASLISGAPTKNGYSLVSTPDRHLVLFGTEGTIGDDTTFDPMFVRFSNQEDLNTFTESATNTAGGQRLTDGNRIVGAVRSRGQILIFTDSSLHGMQYIGPPFTFGFQQLGANCGLIGPHAAVDVNGLAIWMGQEDFFIFDGTVKKLPCSVQDYVFKNINLVQGTKVHVGSNGLFNEVTWWYCTSDSVYINRFVTYNYAENTWHIGTMPRTAWQDVGIYNLPIASQYIPDNTNAPPGDVIYGLTSGRSLIFTQERGYDGNGVAIPAYLQSGYFDIGDGDQVMYMKRFIPDFKDQRGDLICRINLKRYPQVDAEVSSLDPYTITPTTDKVDTRARGRQISLRIEGNELDSWWRFGTLRVDIQPDGLR